MEGSNKADELKSKVDQEVQPQGSDTDDFQKALTYKSENSQKFTLIDDLQNKTAKLTSLDSICYTVRKLMKTHDVDLDGIWYFWNKWVKYNPSDLKYYITLLRPFNVDFLKVIAIWGIKSTMSNPSEFKVNILYTLLFYRLKSIILDKKNRYLSKLALDLVINIAYLYPEYASFYTRVGIGQFFEEALLNENIEMVRKTMNIIENILSKNIELQEHKYGLISLRIFKILKNSRKFSDLRLDCLTCLNAIYKRSRFLLDEYWFQLIPVLTEIFLKENFGKIGHNALSLLSFICKKSVAVPSILEHNGIQVILKSIESSNEILEWTLVMMIHISRSNSKYKEIFSYQKVLNKLARFFENINNDSLMYFFLQAIGLICSGPNSCVKEILKHDFHN